MSAITYHTALSFDQDPEGELCAAHAEVAPTPQSAVLRAVRLARSAKGAVAFSRCIDIDRGLYGHPEVLAAIGELPEDIRAFIPSP
jgi:hypothetical protein